MSPRRFVAVRIACLVLLTVTWAQDTRYAGEFSQVPFGCRAVGMGNAAVAAPLGAEGLVWNPALPGFEEQYRVWVEGARLYGGLSHTGALSLTVPVQNKINLSGAYAAFFSGDIIEQDTLPGTPLERLYDYGKRPDENSGRGVFHNNHHLLTASVAKVFGIPLPRPSGFSVPIPLDVGGGVSFRYYWQTMTPGDKTRMAVNGNLDVGTAVRLGVDYDIEEERICRAVMFGVSVRNVLRTKMVWLYSRDSYEEPVHPSAHFGISYLDETGFLFADWLLSVALHRRYESTLHAGIEATVRDVVSFRVGIADRTFSFGAGIGYRGVTIDYSFSFDELAFTPLRLAVGYAFGVGGGKRERRGGAETR